MLRIVGVAESTYYARKKRQIDGGSQGTKQKKIQVGRPTPRYSWMTDGRKVSDAQIGTWLIELAAGEEHSYGYRLMALALHDQKGLILNHKKSYRLCKKLGLLQKKRRKKCKHPRRLPRNQIIKGPNQLWQMDLKYGYVAGYDRFFYLFDIIDVFDRNIVGYYVGSSCEAKDVCNTVKQALEKRIVPGESLPTVRTDNGTHFVSHAFGAMCEDLGLLHERIPPKTPNMNAYIESFHNNIERDLLTKEYFNSYEEAFECVDRYIEFYNERRYHGSLQKMSPVQYMRAWKAKEIDAVEIAV